MGIYKKIFQAITGSAQGQTKKRQTKNRKPMPTTKTKRRIKLSPAAKENIRGAARKIATAYLSPTQKTAAKPTPKKTPAPPAPKENFWNKKYNWGFIQPTGKQIAIGGTATLVLGGLAINHFRK